MRLLNDTAAFVAVRADVIMVATGRTQKDRLHAEETMLCLHGRGSDLQLEANVSYWRGICCQ